MKSKYKNVSFTKTPNGQPWWVARIRRKEGSINKVYPFTDEGERDAAKAVDLWFIKHNLEPVNNIFKRK